MHKLLEFIQKFKEYFAFTALVLISFWLISLGDVSKLGGFRTVVIGSVGWMQDVFSWFPNTGALRSENKALRELNLQLSSEVTQMRNSVIENKNLRELLGLKPKVEHPTITAEIVGKTNIEMRNYFTISKGTDDGVFEGMSVRNDAGLVGFIIGAADNYSLVELIYNRDIKIAARVQRIGCNGTLSWEGGDKVLLKYVSKAYGVRVSDTLMTSSFSNKYPPNIPIGVVSMVEDISGDIFSTIHVKPLADFNILSQVFVIQYVPDIEKEKLIQQVDQKLKARKGKQR